MNETLTHPDVVDANGDVAHIDDFIIPDFAEGVEPRNAQTGWVSRESVAAASLLRSAANRLNAMSLHPAVSSENVKEANATDLREPAQSILDKYTVDRNRLALFKALAMGQAHGTISVAEAAAISVVVNTKIIAQQPTATSVKLDNYESGSPYNSVGDAAANDRNDT